MTEPVDVERPFQRNAEVETAPLQQDAILFHPRLNRFCILNRTSSFIWNRLESPVSPKQLADELSANFSGVTPDIALNDVQQALSTLISLEMVIAKEN